MIRRLLKIAGLGVALVCTAPIATANSETITVTVYYDEADTCVSNIVSVVPMKAEFDSWKHAVRVVKGEESVVEWKFESTGAPATGVDWFVEAKSASGHQACDARFKPIEASCNARSGFILIDKDWEYSIKAVPKNGTLCTERVFDPSVIFKKGKGTILILWAFGLVLGVIGIFAVYKFMKRNG